MAPPDFVEENQEDESLAGRGATSDLTVRWNYHMTIVIDTAFSRYFLKALKIFINFGYFKNR